jgi:hypothetical protein
MTHTAIQHYFNQAIELNITNYDNLLDGLTKDHPNNKGEINSKFDTNSSRGPSP